MKRNHLSVSSLPFLILLLFHHCKSQPSTTGYACSPKEAYYPCQTYAFYRASIPDLAAIADLFSISRLSISKASNLPSPSAPLSPAQHLLIPMTCSCNSNFSAFNTTYQIQAGDTFYHLSIQEFQNLTTYQAVEAANPSLVPTRLAIGVEVVFPIFCQCPNKTHLENNIKDLITYVFQPSDTLVSIAALLSSSAGLIAAWNSENPPVFSTVLVPISRIPVLEQPPAGHYPSGSTPRKSVIVKLDIGLGVMGAFLLLSIAVIACFWWVLRNRRDRRENEENGLIRPKMAAPVEQSFAMDVSDCLDKYKVYGIEEVREATMDFDRRCLIQGSVYQGNIRGENFAIKKMKWNACEELKILQKVNHSNLVKLEGFCIDPNDGNCYLVYELVENGSLHSWLHGNGNGRSFDWKARLQIAVDVASGLQYIHQHIGPSVVHKDISSSNILLDAKMRAKIANFGLARTGCNAITTKVIGTQGYLAPEYSANGIVSTKMDVFAFGVVLLELVSGNEAVDKQSGRPIWMDAERILDCCCSEEDAGDDGDGDDGGEKEDRLRGWMDRELIIGQCGRLESVRNVMGVAKACLQREASKRPSMVDVVYMLCRANNNFLIFDMSEDGLPVLHGRVVAR